MSMTGRPFLRFALVALLLVASAAVPGAATDLTFSGQIIRIDQPGSYVLTSDVVNCAQFIAIEIRSSDVVLDGGGHLLDGRDSANSAGIYVNGPAGAARNVTVRNVRVTDWFYGVYFHGSVDSKVESAETSSCGFTGVVVYRNATGAAVRDCTLSANGYGIVLSDGADGALIEGNEICGNERGLFDYLSDGVTVTRNTVSGNTVAGIQLRESAGATVYDNRLENAQNVVFEGQPAGTHTWSVAPRAGPNVLGGPSVGGNFWATPDGLGHSQLTADGDGDGFSDGPFEIAPGNIDEHPLAPSVGFVPTPCTTPPPATPTPTPEPPTPTADPPTPTSAPPTPTGTAGPTLLVWNGTKIVIDAPGTYVLQNDIVDAGGLLGIYIQASNVVLDGDGHLVDGTDANNSAGVLVDGTAGPLSNVVVKNLRVRDWCYGVYLLGATDSRITGCTLVSNPSAGIVLYNGAVRNEVMGCTLSENGCGVALSSGASGCTVRGCGIVDNGDGLLVAYASDGLTILQSVITRNAGAGVRFRASGGATVYDNGFSNDLDVAFDDVPPLPNAWSVEPGEPWRPGNFLGGPRVGGNYWANPNRTGFSETHADADGDGFCDVPLVLADGNVDAHPLAPNVAPSPTCTGCSEPTPITTATVTPPTPTTTATASPPDPTVMPTGASTTSPPGPIGIPGLSALPGGALPSDPDRDDAYDDVNGNGRADFADVVLYFNSMGWIAENAPLLAFDFNRNGRIDFADVVWLFDQL
jgi:parallel beta-helix repeat protein